VPPRRARERWKQAATPPTVGAEVLGARVEVAGEDGGRVTGILAHPANRAIGLEVTSPGSARRFLPLAAATLSDGVVDVASWLHFVDWLDTYVDAGATVFRDVAGLEKLRAPAQRVRAGVSTAPATGSPPR
jgi:hypothetical protein